MRLVEGERTERVERMARTSVADLRALVERTRPVSTAEQRVLPVLSVLEDLLPDRGLRRGSLVQIGGVQGATSLALAVAAGPTRAGSWVACVGVGGLGWSAAAEAGVDLERLVVLHTAPSSWAAVVAALVDAFDVVLCGPDHVPSTTEARRLRARARERGAVLVALEQGSASSATRRAWPAADVGLQVVAGRWQGLGQGWGHLRSRVVTVEVGGRGAVVRGRRRDLLLPGPTGAPAPVPSDGVHEAPAERGVRRDAARGGGLPVRAVRRRAG